MNCDLVLEGGGTKIPGLVGAYRVIRDQGFTVANVAGTSAGSIVGAMIAAGYSPEEMREIVYEMPFNKFLDGGKWPWQKGWNFIRHWGLYRGKEFQKFIGQQLAAKGVETFSDLVTDREVDKHDPRYRWKLKVIVSDVTNKRLAVFPNDAPLYGVEPDDMSVSLAVRMSMSIPFFFRPVKWKGATFVDGGMLSNFPIWMFDSDGKPEWPTFGLLLKEKGWGEPEEYKSLRSYIGGLLNTMIQAHDRKNVSPEDSIYRTIAIPTLDIGTTDFDMAVVDKQRIYQSGRDTANEFFETWRWRDYKRWATKKRKGIKK